MKRVRIGHIFVAKIDDEHKRYFQYIARDLNQLNSDVIRVFKKVYSVEETPSLSEILADEIDFYVHCCVRAGVKYNLWEYADKSSELGCIEDILFRDTNDYGTQSGQKPIKISWNWHIWRINDNGYTNVGLLIGKYRKAYMGLVINPWGIIEMLKGNEYPLNYPGFF